MPPISGYARKQGRRPAGPPPSCPQPRGSPARPSTASRRSSSAQRGRTSSAIRGSASSLPACGSGSLAADAATAAAGRGRLSGPGMSVRAVMRWREQRWPSRRPLRNPSAHSAHPGVPACLGRLAVGRHGAANSLCQIVIPVQLAAVGHASGALRPSCSSVMSRSSIPPPAIDDQCGHAAEHRANAAPPRRGLVHCHTAC